MGRAQAVEAAAVGEMAAQVMVAGRATAEEREAGEGTRREVVAVWERAVVVRMDMEVDRTAVVTAAAEVVKAAAGVVTAVQVVAATADVAAEVTGEGD